MSFFSGRNKNESVFFKTDRADMVWKAISESDLILISLRPLSEPHNYRSGPASQIEQPKDGHHLVRQ